MAILFSPSLNTEFDTSVTPLDQIPADALLSSKSAKVAEKVTLEITAAPVEIKAEVLADTSKSKKG